MPSWLKSLVQKSNPAIDLVKAREGLRLKWYKDTLGKWTGGYGHLRLPGEEGMVITPALADSWLKGDIQTATSAATEQCSKLPFYTEEFLSTLVSVNFQLGTQWYTKFPKTWSLILSGKYDEAAWEAEDSDWAKQTPVRVRDFQRALWRLSCLYEVYSSLS